MKRAARRHQSLIPLSREHQYALLLCLRIHRGLSEHGNDIDWVRARSVTALRFFDQELILHFKAEEQILFPAMSEMAGAPEIIEELLQEHRRLHQLADRLRGDHALQGGTLQEFADTLEAHIRKEERSLFPIYEQQASPGVTSTVEKGIQSLIGSAIRPKHPELLK
jgi:iron-sulfur cluster repair protein YtfE (RIC family)